MRPLRQNRASDRRKSHSRDSSPLKVHPPAKKGANFGRTPGRPARDRRMGGPRHKKYCNVEYKGAKCIPGTAIKTENARAAAEWMGGGAQLTSIKLYSISWASSLSYGPRPIPLPQDSGAEFYLGFPYGPRLPLPLKWLRIRDFPWGHISVVRSVSVAGRFLRPYAKRGRLRQKSLLGRPVSCVKGGRRMGTGRSAAAGAKHADDVFVISQKGAAPIAGARLLRNAAPL